MKNTQLVHFTIDLPSLGLIERYCRNMEITVAKFTRDALRTSLIDKVDAGRIKNDTGMHVNHLLPNIAQGRPRKVKPEDNVPAATSSSYNDTL